MCVQIFTFRGQNPYFAYISSPFPFLGLLGGIFHFYSNFKKNKQTNSGEPDQTPRFAASHLYFCTVCRCSTKRTLGLYGLNMHS